MAAAVISTRGPAAGAAPGMGLCAGGAAHRPRPTSWPGLGAGKDRAANARWARRVLPAPHLPGAAAAAQQRLDRLQILEGIDAQPEPAIVAAEQLAFVDHPLKRLLDQILARPQ